MGFIELLPPGGFECMIDGKMVTDCTQEMICAPNSKVDSYSIDYTNNKNIKNWVE
jgi:hypothetical protein